MRFKCDSPNTEVPEADFFRQIGAVVGRMSINSVAVGQAFSWMQQTPLAPLIDLQAEGSATMIIPLLNLTPLIGQIRRTGTPDAFGIADALSDAAEEALWRERALGIVMS